MSGCTARRKCRRAHLGKNRHRIDHAPSGEQFRPVGLRHERPVRPFKLAHRGIAVQPDPEKIAKSARLGQVAQMADMQQVEAAVGGHDDAAFPAQLLAKSGDFVKSQNFAGSHPIKVSQN